MMVRKRKTLKTLITKLRSYKFLRAIIVIFVILIGLFLRFYVMKRGHNFDFDSYKIVGDAVRRGSNVYAETSRYNYGPVWFLILGLFRSISSLFSNIDLVFRLLIVSLLSFADLGIAFILKRKYGLIAFVLFFLNPVSIIITGYHNQFDNLAILIGMLGLIILPDANTKKLEKRHVYSVLLIGLSLMTKHLFFMIPVWLFIKSPTLRTKLFMLLTPIAIFLVSFIPFWKVGHNGIMQNVFMYRSFANAPFLHAIFSPGVIAIINPTALFIVLLVAAGFIFRKLSYFESGLCYLLVLVTFSPAVANQYLAIVLPAVCALGFVFFIPFLILAIFLLAGTSIEGLNLQAIINIIPKRILPYITPHGACSQYNLIIFCLFIGLVLAAIYKYRRSWYVNFYSKLKNILYIQLNSLK